MILTGCLGPVKAQRIGKYKVSVPSGHQLDYIVIEEGRTIGRMYEDLHAPADYRGFWSITLHIDLVLGIVTNGRVPSLEEAKTSFKASWGKVRAP